MKSRWLITLGAALILAVTFVPLSLAGQSTWPAPYKQKVSTRVYQAPFDKVFDAVVSVTGAYNFPLVVNNRPTGVILTDYASMGDISAAPGQVRLDFHITRVDEKSTQVQLNIESQGYSAASGRASEDSFIDEDNYGDAFDAISKEINKGEAASTQDSQDPYAFPSPRPSAPDIFQSTL